MSCTSSTVCDTPLFSPPPIVNSESPLPGFKTSTESVAGSSRCAAFSLSYDDLVERLTREGASLPPALALSSFTALRLANMRKMHTIKGFSPHSSLTAVHSRQTAISTVPDGQIITVLNVPRCLWRCVCSCVCMTISLSNEWGRENLIIA